MKFPTLVKRLHARGEAVSEEQDNVSAHDPMCLGVCVYMCVYSSRSLRILLCVREQERERAGETDCVHVCERERDRGGDVREI